MVYVYEYVIKLSRLLKMAKFWGPKGNCQKRRLRYIEKLNLHVTFKKLLRVMK